MIVPRQSPGSHRSPSIICEIGYKRGEGLSSHKDAIFGVNAIARDVGLKIGSAQRSSMHEFEK